MSAVTFRVQNCAPLRDDFHLSSGGQRVCFCCLLCVWCFLEVGESPVQNLRYTALPTDCCQDFILCLIYFCLLVILVDLSIANLAFFMLAAAKRVLCCRSFFVLDLKKMLKCNIHFLQSPGNRCFWAHFNFSNKARLVQHKHVPVPGPVQPQGTDVGWGNVWFCHCLTRKIPDNDFQNMRQIVQTVIANTNRKKEH